MEDELEIVAAASVGAVAKDIDGDGYLEGPCPNCGAMLMGEYCASCGQSAMDMQRPFWTLIKDVLDNVFSLDGRLWRTVPALIFRPGHVTRSYLDGKRARYVPPFRLFLIASVLFFLVLFGIFEGQDWMEGEDLSVTSTVAQITDLTVGETVVSDVEGFEDIFDEEGAFDRAAAEVFAENLAASGAFEDTEMTPERLVDRMEAMSGRTVSRAELFGAIQRWAPRLSFLLLPFYMILLAMMHFWMRRVYIYDHLVVALHLQTYLYGSATLAMLFAFVSPGWAWGIFGVSLPVYLFLMLGRSYGTNWFFNLFRTFTLLIVSFVALILLIVAVSLVGANEIGVLEWADLAEPFGDFE